MQLSQDLARFHAEAGAAKIVFDFGQVPKVNRATVRLQADFSNCRAQRAGTRPSGKEGRLSEPADYPQSRKGIGHIVPESDREDQVEPLISFPIEYIVEDELAFVGDALLLGKLGGQFKHLGREIEPGHLSPALGQTGDEAA